MGRASTPTQHRTKVGADCYAVLLNFDMRGSRHTVQDQNTSAAPPAIVRFRYTIRKRQRCRYNVHGSSVHQCMASEWLAGQFLDGMRTGFLTPFFSSCHCRGKSDWRILGVLDAPGRFVPAPGDLDRRVPRARRGNHCRARRAGCQLWARLWAQQMPAHRT
jgi:hypothetical protein